MLGDGSNRYQLLAVEDLVDATVSAASKDVAGETFNVGATEFGTVRSDLEGLIARAGSVSRLRPVPARLAELALRALELARPHRWPSGTTARHTETRTWTLEGAAAARLSRRGSRTSRRSARPTTGTWPTAEGLAKAGVPPRPRGKARPGPA